MSECFMIPKENYDKVFSRLAQLSDQHTELRAQNKALKEALEAVEWEAGSEHDTCPYCWHWRVNGHAPSCKIGVIKAWGTV